jgi:uncharacterized protein YrzB (UPF0473 family)
MGESALSDKRTGPGYPDPEVPVPFSPHLERFTFTEDGVEVLAVALASQSLGGREVVLLLPENALDNEGDDMDAWLRELGPNGDLLEIDDEAILEQAWDLFEDVLQLTFSDEAEA